MTEIQSESINQLRANGQGKARTSTSNASAAAKKSISLQKGRLWTPVLSDGEKITVSDSGISLFGLLGGRRTYDYECQHTQEANR